MQFSKKKKIYTLAKEYKKPHPLPTKNKCKIKLKQVNRTILKIYDRNAKELRFYSYSIINRNGITDIYKYTQVEKGENFYVEISHKYECRKNIFSALSYIDSLHSNYLLLLKIRIDIYSLESIPTQSLRSFLNSVSQTQRRNCVNLSRSTLPTRFHLAQNFKNIKAVYIYYHDVFTLQNYYERHYRKQKFRFSSRGVLIICHK